MAVQPEVSQFDETVYAFETTDVIEGGPDGIDNVPLLNLANRTRWLKNNTWLTGDVKMVHCTQTYINNNFVTTPGPTQGLGTNERLGWAICNGINGTKPMAGQVPIGYGMSGDYTGIGTGVGSYTKALPFVGYGVGGEPEDGAPGQLIVSTGQEETGESFESMAYADSGAQINVVQPSLITLFIQKI